MSYEAFANTYVGVRRTRYMEAAKSLRQTPVMRKDARLSSFIKLEKTDPNAKKSPDPRVIQARQPRYGVALGCYLKPMEHLMYNIEGPMGTRVIGKGLNVRQRAELLAAKRRNFRDPVVIGLDCSRFDMHVTVDQLRVEHSVYLAMHFCPELQQLLSWQLDNRGTTTRGIKYRCPGGRMSGDMNTALGNCMLMYLMSRGAMEQLGIKRFDLLVDGDDTLVILERADLALAQAGLPGWFLEFGHTLKVESISDCMEDVVWCQGRPLWDGTVWRFVRPWRKVLSTLAAGGKHWLQPTQHVDMCYTVGQCLMAEASGVPILQEFAQALMSLGGKIIKDFYLDKLSVKYAIEGGAKEAIPVTPEARESFERGWGVSVESQHELEAALRVWKPPVGMPEERGAEIYSKWRLSYDYRDEPLPAPDGGLQ
jgi:hypothetical protein